MLTIENGLIWLYCHFNKIMKEPGTSFQSLVLSQKKFFSEKVLTFFLKLDLVFPHQSLAEEWLCSVFLIQQEKFVVKENSGLRNEELLKYHESFPILVFQWTLSTKIAL